MVSVCAAASGWAAATSKIPTERSVPFTEKLPAANSMSPGATSRRCAATVFPFSRIASETLPRTMLPNRIERPEREAAPPAAPARLVAARGKTLPVAQGERGGHHHSVRAAVVAEPERISVRHRRFRDEVAPPQFHAVESVRVRREVDQPLDDEDRLGPEIGRAHV